MRLGKRERMAKRAAIAERKALRTAVSEAYDSLPTRSGLRTSSGRSTLKAGTHTGFKEPMGAAITMRLERAPSQRWFNMSHRFTLVTEAGTDLIGIDNRAKADKEAKRLTIEGRWGKITVRDDKPWLATDYSRLGALTLKRLKDAGN